ncbi:hypothetical protein ACKI1J_25020 [Streptomyces scabiei]
MAGLVAVPGTASAAAAGRCTRGQHKTYATIGANLDVHVALCVSRTPGNDCRATVRFRWSDGGGGLGTGRDKLKVNLRLERNDVTRRNGSADWAEATNFARTGGWTADGDIGWDIDNDGTGGGTTPLQGSPEIQRHPGVVRRTMREGLPVDR